jgi:hypothetical protein
MLSRRLSEIIGLACGFVLVDYGFSLLAAGFPGTRQLTSQFLGFNLLAGGSVVAFISVFYLLKPLTPITPSTQPSGRPPDIGVELVVEDQPPSQFGFYKNIEYIGYIFTALGLFAAVDLVLQVLIPSLYNEVRWWVEVLLVTFGVLSYAIFGSIGRLGAQEERAYVRTMPSPTPTALPSLSEVAQEVPPSYPQVLEMRIGDFSKSASGEYERHLSGTVYDMFRVESEVVSVWREERLEMRSVYLAGPYELSRKLMEEYVTRGEELKIGHLFISVETLRDLLRLQNRSVETPHARAN